jgi:hypothetical protein
MKAVAVAHTLKAVTRTSELEIISSGAFYAISATVYLICDKSRRSLACSTDLWPKLWPDFGESRLGTQTQTQSGKHGCSTTAWSVSRSSDPQVFDPLRACRLVFLYMVLLLYVVCYFVRGSAFMVFFICTDARNCRLHGV